MGSHKESHSLDCSKDPGEVLIDFAAHESCFYVPGRSRLPHLENRATFRGEN